MLKTTLKTTIAASALLIGSSASGYTQMLPIFNQLLNQLPAYAAQMQPYRPPPMYAPLPQQYHAIEPGYTPPVYPGAVYSNGQPAPPPANIQGQACTQPSTSVTDNFAWTAYTNCLNGHTQKIEPPINSKYLRPLVNHDADPRCTVETISARLGGSGKDTQQSCNMPTGQDNAMLGAYRMRVNQARALCQMQNKQPDAPRARECDVAEHGKAIMAPELVAQAIIELNQHAKNCLWNGVVHQYMIDAPQRCGLGNDPRAQAYALVLAFAFD